MSDKELLDASFGEALEKAKEGIGVEENGILSGNGWGLYVLLGLTSLLALRLFLIRGLSQIISLAFNVIGKGRLYPGQIGYFNLSGFSYELKRNSWFSLGVDLIALKYNSNNNNSCMNNSLFSIELENVQADAEVSLVKSKEKEKKSLLRSLRGAKNDVQKEVAKKKGFFARIMKRLKGTLIAHLAKMVSVSVDKVHIRMRLREIPGFVCSIEIPKGISLFSDTISTVNCHTTNISLFARSIVFKLAQGAGGQVMGISSLKVPLHVQISIMEYDHYSVPKLEQVLVNLGKVMGSVNVKQMLGMWQAVHIMDLEMGDVNDEPLKAMEHKEIKEASKDAFLAKVHQFMQIIPAFSQLTVDVMNVIFESIPVNETCCELDCRIDRSCFTVSRHQDRGLLLSERLEKCDFCVEFMGLYASFRAQKEDKKEPKECCSFIKRIDWALEFGNNFMSKGFGVSAKSIVLSPHLAVNSCMITAFSTLCFGLMLLKKDDDNKKTAKLRVFRGDKTVFREFMRFLGESSVRVHFDITNISCSWLELDSSKRPVLEMYLNEVCMSFDSSPLALSEARTRKVHYAFKSSFTFKLDLLWAGFCNFLRSGSNKSLINIHPIGSIIYCNEISFSTGETPLPLVCCLGECDESIESITDLEAGCMSFKVGVLSCELSTKLMELLNSTVKCCMDGICKQTLPKIQIRNGAPPKLPSIAIFGDDSDHTIVLGLTFRGNVGVVGALVSYDLQSYGKSGEELGVFVCVQNLKLKGDVHSRNAHMLIESSSLHRIKKNGFKFSHITRDMLNSKVNSSCYFKCLKINIACSFLKKALDFKSNAKKAYFMHSIPDHYFVHELLTTLVKLKNELLKKVKSLKASNAHNFSNSSKLGTSGTKKSVSLDIEDIEIEFPTVGKTICSLVVSTMSFSMLKDAHRPICWSCRIYSANLKLSEQNILSASNVFIQKMNTVMARAIQTHLGKQQDLWSVEGKGVSVKGDRCALEFPYMYRFDENLNDIQNSIKSIKALYKGNVVAKVDSGPKPSIFSGLWFAFSSLDIQFQDSDLDYALQRIYELGLDEAVERELRQKEFDSKLELIKSSMGSAISGFDTRDMQDKLNAQNSKIYCERMMKLKQNLPPNRNLFQICLSECKLFLWREPGICQYDSIVGMMQEVDPQNPIPNDIVFNLLFGRRLFLSSSIFCIKLRDYPTPLLIAKAAVLRGNFVVAESFPDPTAIRFCEVDLQRDTNRFIKVKRSMPPVKFYPDLAWSSESFSACWGPCYEPALSEVSDAFSFLSKKSIDPSKVLPFFDKFRLIFHCRLEMSVRKFTMSIPSTRKPYNISEKFQWCFENVDILWFNSKIVYEAMLCKFQIRTASVLDKLSMWTLPEVRIVFQFVWNCPFKANHHTVMPCNPEFLSGDDLKTHDSFKAVRSSSAHFSVTVESRYFPFGENIPSSAGCKEYEDPSTEPQYPTEKPETASELVFFASTFAWLNRFFAVLKTTSLPVRRGTIPGISTLPKFSKLKLGRHFSKMDFRISYPCVNVRYWSSASSLNGLEFRTGKFKFLTAHSITLKPFDDNLYRRERKVWATEQMVLESCGFFVGAFDSEIHDVDIAQGEKFKDGMMVLNIDDMESSHVLSCSHLFYWRGDYFSDTVKEMTLRKDRKPEELNDCQYKDQPCGNNVLVYDVKGTWTELTGRAVNAASSVYEEWSAVDKYVASNPELEPNIEIAKNIETERIVKNRRKMSMPANVFASNPMLNKLIGDLKREKGEFLARTEDVLGDSGEFFNEDKPSKKSANDVIYLDDYGDIVQGDFFLKIVRGQVLIGGDRGVDGSTGKIIVSSQETRVVRQIHRPILAHGKQNIYMKKVTIGSLQKLQILVGSVNELLDDGDDTTWLPTDVIGMQNSEEIDQKLSDIELVRVSSQFSCSFSNSSFNCDLEESSLEDIDWLVRPQGEAESLSDTLNLEMGTMELISNSKQDSIVFNVICTLIQKMAPERKEKKDDLETIKYSLKLANSSQFESIIFLLQQDLRQLMESIRLYERTLFYLSSKKDKNKEKRELVESCLQCLKDTKSKAIRNLALFVEAVRWHLSEKSSSLKKGPVEEKTIHILLRDANWTLVNAKGSPITDLKFCNFRFMHTIFLDESSIQKLELGSIALNDRLTGSVYDKAIEPYVNGQSIVTSTFDKDTILRIYTRKIPSVGGIRLMEHFEVNIAPLKVQITQQLYTELFNYYFPPASSTEDNDAKSVPMLERCLELEEEVLKDINAKVEMCEDEPDKTLLNLQSEQETRVNELKELIALCLVRQSLSSQSENLTSISESTSKHRRPKSNSTSKENPLPLDTVSQAAAKHFRTRSNSFFKSSKVPELQFQSSLISGSNEIEDVDVTAATILEDDRNSTDFKATNVTVTLLTLPETERRPRGSPKSPRPSNQGLGVVEESKMVTSLSDKNFGWKNSSKFSLRENAYETIDKSASVRAKRSRRVSVSIPETGTPSLQGTSGSDGATVQAQGRSRRASIFGGGSSTAAASSSVSEGNIKRKAKFVKKKSQKKSLSEVEEMKSRASKTLSFVYVKIPTVQLCVSYKGEGGAQILDVNEFILNLPMLEYHSKTWTWFDLLMQIKKDTITALISQLVKQKINIKKGKRSSKGKDVASVEGNNNGMLEKKKYFWSLRTSGSRDQDIKIDDGAEGDYDIKKASMLLGKKFETTFRKGKAFLVEAVTKGEQTEQEKDGNGEEQSDEEPADIVMPRKIKRKTSISELLSNFADRIPGSPLFGSPVNSPPISHHDLIGKQISERTISDETSGFRQTGKRKGSASGLEPLLHRQKSSLVGKGIAEADGEAVMTAVITSDCENTPQQSDQDSSGPTLQT
eukprot:Nk52_evm8s2579 gene=Nk52_evmTU8s2579